MAAWPNKGENKKVKISAYGRLFEKNEFIGDQSAIRGHKLMKTDNYPFGYYQSQNHNILLFDKPYVIFMLKLCWESILIPF